MTLTRILLASTAISLAGLGSSHAAPFALASTLAPARPAMTQYLTQVQLSVADAQARLEAAVARKAEAEASGGDVAAAQAEIDAAQADLEAAQGAVEGGAETQATPTPEPEATPEAEAAPEPTEQPAAEEPTASEQAPQPEAEAATEGSADTGTAEEPAPETEQPASDRSSSEPAPEAAPEAAPAEEAAPEEPVTPQSTTGEQDPAPEAEAPAEPAAEPVPAQEPATEPAPGAEPQPEAGAGSKATPEATEPVTPTEPEQSGEAEAATGEEAPAEPATEQAPAMDQSGENAGQPDEAAEEPAEQAAEGTEEAKEGEVLTLPVEDGAPVLDSAKEEQPAPAEGEATQSAAPAASEPAAPPPTSDAEAQGSTAESQPAPKAFAETGERTADRPAPETQTNVTIVNQYDNRTIIEVDNRTIIEHDERDRLREGSNEVYYERLRGGRVREVIVRPNGVQLVTVTNRWGDVIQRSRVMPDGQEYVLFYAEANSDGSRDAFVDPGRRLPPLRLSIPIGDYILDATDAEPSAYLEFLMEPPVERVERLYSVEEVRRSARIRDKVRRIDMDSLTFEFGKATIDQGQVQRLSDVADAMTRILERNPAETFLIEGHTDAVGRDEANLLLSDRRAETVAIALSDVFGIPPENLITQGYGERYLKVRTEEPERLNRRVTIRRITPLVTPVASR